jgi:hypothetical protein
LTYHYIFDYLRQLPRYKRKPTPKPKPRTVTNHYYYQQLDNNELDNYHTYTEWTTLHCGIYTSMDKKKRKG